MSLDPHLSYNSHITNLVSSCMAKLCEINRVKNSFDVTTLSIISKLMCCSTVRSNTSSKNIKKLQAVQNFAYKFIMNSKKYDHVTLLLKEMNWLPIKDVLYFREAVMCYKCMNLLAPVYLRSKFQ